MKRFIKIISVAVICVALGAGLFTASAANTGTVLYKNDFSIGLDDTMDFKHSGTAETVTQFGETFMRCTPLTSGTRAFRMNFGPEETKNVDISFRIRSTASQTNTSAFFGVYFRCPSIPANALFGYQLRLSDTKTSLVLMDNYADTTSTIITEDAVTAYKTGLWYNIKICLRDTRIVVFVNGNKIMDLEDDYYLSDGSFGICGVRYIFDIDDILITGYKGKLPEPTPNEAPTWVGDPTANYKADIADSGKERLNLSIIGGEQGGGTTKVSVVNPNELTINSWIAVGLIAALIIMAVSTLIVSTNLIKLIKLNKSSAPTTETEENDNVGEEKAE